MNRSRISRRTFVKAVGFSGVGLALPYGATVPLVRAQSPSRKLNLASIGVAGKGWEDLISTSGDGKRHNVLAICDIDHRDGGKQPDNLHSGQKARPLGLGAAAKRFPQAQVFADYRELFDKLGSKLDAVTISTPDHMHATIALAAMDLGIHVYVQKPLTATPHESRVLRQFAEQRNIITQMGNQFHSSVGYRCLVDMMQKHQPIGRVREVHAWTPSPNWPQGVGRPAGEDAVPQGVHWDLWLGVAEKRPFKEHMYHNFNWRGWADFGTGALGDMGCHILDPVVWSLELGPPSTIIAECDAFNGETYPLGSKVTYTFPGTRFTAPTLKVIWYDGGRRPAASLAQGPEGYRLPANGTLFIGEHGTMVTAHAPTVPRLFPEETFHDFSRTTLRELFASFESQDHYQMWTNAILDNQQANSPFSYAGPLNETVMLGTIAQRLAGRELSWNAESMRFNDNDATAMVRRTYRKGWETPALA